MYVLVLVEAIPLRQPSPSDLLSNMQIVSNVGGYLV